jgi:CRP-like cAMP-binding protein
MFAIVEGTVEIVRGGKVLETLDAGNFFGEMSLIDKSPRSASARAKTECKIVAIDEKRFGFMVQQTPFFALEVMRALATRLRHRLAEQD